MTFLLRNSFLIGILILLGLTAWLAHLRADDAFIITFTSTRTGFHEVYVMGIDGSHLQRLTNFHRSSKYQWYSYPYWDESEECIVIADYFERNCVNLRGQLTIEPKPPGLAYSPRISSPSSSDFAYTGTNDGNWFLFSVKELGLFRAHPNGSDLKYLAGNNVTTIRYLRERKQIVYFDDGWYIVSIDGTGKHFIHNSITMPLDVDVSPNRKFLTARIEYLAQDDNRYRSVFKIVNRETSQTYTFLVLTFRHPMWSPDSRYLLYDGEHGFHSFDMFCHCDELIFEVKDQMRSSSTYETHTDSIEPQWSPNGELLLKQYYGDLYIIQPDGSQFVNLSDHRFTSSPHVPSNQFDQFNHKNAHWSPDSTWIIFQSERQGKTSELFVARYDGAKIQNVTNDPNWDVEPNWVPFEGRNWHPEYLLTGSITGILAMFVGSAIRSRKRKMERYA